MRMRVFMLLSLVLLVFAAGSGMAESKKKTELCRVCAVMEGEEGEETVKAHRTHDGVEYGFCSKACAKKFDEDPTAFLPPVLPRPAPAFALEDLSGEAVSVEGNKGKVMLVDFWATWCVPCRTSMPELQVLQDEFGERGFTVVGVSIDEAKHAKRVREFVEEHGIQYPVAMDTGDAPAWDAYRVKAIPAAFLIDAEGQIIEQWTGKTADVEGLRKKLAKLLSADQP